jgi:hypothetical protein
VVDINIVTLQHNTDTTEVQSVSCDETKLTFCDSDNLQTEIKEEEDPLSETFPVPKTESEVSCICVSLLLNTFHNRMHECQLPFVFFCYQVNLSW